MPKKCFFIAPIGIEGTIERKRSDQILHHVIKPATKACGYEVFRADQIPSPGIIDHQIIHHLLNDELVIADLTGSNPNVTYELALRHAFRRHVIQIKDSSDRLPFDISGMRTIDVDYRFVESMDRCKSEIIKHIQTIEKDWEKVESPVTSALNYISITKSDDLRDKVILDLASKIEALSSKVDGISKVGIPGMYKVLEEEKRHNERTKSYYVIRIKSYYDRFLSVYEEFKSSVQAYIKDRSEDNWSKLIRSTSRFSAQIDVFVNEALEDIKPILHLLNSPRILDKYSQMVSFIGSQLKGSLPSEYWKHDTSSALIKKIQEIDSAIDELQQFDNDLSDEISDL